MLFLFELLKYFVLIGFSIDLELISLFLLKSNCLIELCQNVDNF